MATSSRPCFSPEVNARGDFIQTVFFSRPIRCRMKEKFFVHFPDVADLEDRANNPTEPAETAEPAAPFSSALPEPKSSFLEDEEPVQKAKTVDNDWMDFDSLDGVEEQSGDRVEFSGRGVQEDHRRGPQAAVGWAEARRRVPTSSSSTSARSNADKGNERPSFLEEGEGATAHQKMEKTLQSTMFQVEEFESVRAADDPYGPYLWKRWSARDDGGDVEHPVLCDGVIDEKEKMPYKRCGNPNPKNFDFTHNELCLRVALLVDLIWA